MTAIGTLGLTSDDVATDLNPLAEAGLFSVGTAAGQIATATIETRLAEIDEWILSSLPERYRRLARRVEGEIAVEYATAAQPSFTLALHPVTAGTLRLFVDWNLDLSAGSNGPAINAAGTNSGQWYSFGTPGSRPYARRTPADALPATAYTLTAATGVVVMATPLALGESICADYDHTGFTVCHFLRRLALDLVGARLTKSLPDLTVEAWNNADKTETTAKAVLLGITDGTIGIDTLDNIKLVPDYETREAAKTRTLPITSYW